MNVGKALRLRRIVDPATNSSVMFAFSHGTSSYELIGGLEHPKEMARAALRAGADCIFLAPGLVEAVGDVLGEDRNLGVAVKVTATASRGEVPYQETLTTSVERCLDLGADAVVALIPFAPENEPDVIRLTAALGESCSRWSVPFIAEAEFPNAYHTEQGFPGREGEAGLSYLKRSARLCAELGADIVKSNWTGSTATFAKIVEAVPVPVVVAGGSRESDLDLLRKVQQARAAGAIGCSVGRNVFQHDRPEAMLRAICGVVRGGLSPEDACERELGTAPAPSLVEA